MKEAYFLPPFGLPLSTTRKFKHARLYILPREGLLSLHAGLPAALCAYIDAKYRCMGWEML